MFRLSILLPVAVAVAGLVWVLTVGTILGMLLVIGGVGALGWTMFPDVVDRFARFLSTGSFRRG